MPVTEHDELFVRVVEWQRSTAPDSWRAMQLIDDLASALRAALAAPPQPQPLGQADWIYQPEYDMHVPCCTRQGRSWRCHNGPLVGEAITTGDCGEHAASAGSATPPRRITGEPPGWEGTRALHERHVAGSATPTAENDDD